MKKKINKATALDKDTKVTEVTEATEATENKGSKVKGAGKGKKVAGGKGKKVADGKGKKATEVTDGKCSKGTGTADAKKAYIPDMIPIEVEVTDPVETPRTLDAIAEKMELHIDELTRILHDKLLKTFGEVVAPYVPTNDFAYAFMDGFEEGFTSGVVEYNCDTFPDFPLLKSDYAISKIEPQNEEDMNFIDIFNFGVKSGHTAGYKDKQKIGTRTIKEYYADPATFFLNSKYR